MKPSFFLLLTFILLPALGQSQMGDRLHLEFGVNYSKTSNQSTLYSFSTLNFRRSEYDRMEGRFISNFHFGISVELFKNHSLIFKYGRFDMKQNVDARLIHSYQIQNTTIEEFENADQVIPILFSGLYYEYSFPFKMINILTQVGFQRQITHSYGIGLDMIPFEDPQYHIYSSVGIGKKINPRAEVKLKGILNKGPLRETLQSKSQYLDGFFDPLTFGAEIELRFRFWGDE